MITVYKTNTMKCAEQCISECLQKVDPLRLDVGHVVIVPDRASYEAERQLLATLGGSFNVRVLTFRRLANEVLGNCNYLSKQSALIALSRIISESKGDFVCYSKGVGSSGFVEGMQETVSQLKYCKIPPERLFDEKIPRSLKGKLHDVGVVYERYQRFLQSGYVDSADKISALSQNAENDPVVKNSFFYLYDFDNFSKQELDVIENLIKYSKGVTVACCVSDRPSRKYLYLNDIYGGITEVCNKLKVTPTVIAKTFHQNRYTEVIGNELYSFGKELAPAFANQEFVKVFEGTTRVQEVYALACQIHRYLRADSRHRYGDVYVVTSDVDSYVNAVSTVFDEFNIPYFCDRQYRLATQNYVQFITDYLACVKSNFRLGEVLSLIKNVLFDQSGDVYAFENYCLKFNCGYDFSKFELGKDDPLYEKAERIRTKLYSLISANVFPAVAGTDDYVDCVRRLVEFANLKQANEELCLRQSEESQKISRWNEFAKATKQAVDKFESVLSQIKEISQNRTVEFEEFERLLITAVSSVNISVLPPASDSVVFANMAKARKHDVKFLALLGANQSQMPIVKSDGKLLSDKNIDEMSKLGIAVEPKIYVENKRERFSLYQLLQEPTEKLYVSYAVSDGNDSLLPSTFVLQLKTLFRGCDAETKADEDVYTQRQAISKLVLSARRIKDNQPVKMKYYSQLKKHFADEVAKFTYEKDGKALSVKGGKDVFLQNSSTSVSKITDFFSCPYKFFIRYGLDVKPRQVAELQSKDLGDVLHAVLEKYVKSIVIAESDGATKQRAEKIFDEVLQKDVYRAMLGDASMKNTLKQLRKEAVKMCTVVKGQLANSRFHNSYTELVFGSDSKIDGVDVDFGNGKFSLKGKIDRVDCCGNDFIVIDYKSGSAKYSESGLYVGQKLQLLVYAKAMQNYKKEMRLCGYYYFNLHNNFTDSGNEKVYGYSGRTLADTEVVQKIDNTFEQNGGKSTLLNVKLNKDGTFDKKCSALTESQMSAQIDYAMKLIADAGERMSKGYVAVSPCENTCDYCDYYSVCDYKDIWVYPERKCQQSVSALNLEEIVKNDKKSD